MALINIKNLTIIIQIIGAAKERRSYVETGSIIKNQEGPASVLVYNQQFSTLETKVSNFL
jgi:hypothetical protein